MYEQHLNSKKHKQKQKNIKRKNSNSTHDGGSVMIKESDDHSDSNNPFDEEFVSKSLTENSKIEEPRKTSMDSLRICLFCNKPSEGVKRNLDHMRVEHSFYILDIDCLISLKALLHYLSEKIHVGHCCVNCNRNFKDVLSVQNHMKDLSPLLNELASFEDEYEYFYDFSPTYEEGFVGKTLEDFDLTEEPLAKPISTKIFSQVEDQPQEDMEVQGEPMEDIAENEHDNDDEWEDVDVEDEDEDKVESMTGSYQQVSAPSLSSFTLINKTSTGVLSHGKDQQSASDNPNEEVKGSTEPTNIADAELARLLERRKKHRFDYEKVTNAYKQAEVLDTGEVKLPSGKILGHRQWAREYKQRLNLDDEKEKLIIKKLGLEYGKLGTVAVQQHFDHAKIIQKYNHAKMRTKDQKGQLKMGMKGNKILTTHFRAQIL
eukprot:CAMPEP_0168329140 /NCGR_PEP_ID=MMETSP0213-20121227/6930_1 /TAXON_ID=151035 /ORGANISM="Euplotes harpa, Strain FSP1.4" /LENGTH=429 /DNA_ID=CAMNT_0008332407 /DNA_START=312 /DNA_END=1601 /DNA_ORIENTATION=-